MVSVSQPLAMAWTDLDFTNGANPILQPRPPEHLMLIDSAMVADFAHQRLMWFEELGWGYFPVRNPVYDQAYFDRYAALADTPLGISLMAARVALVSRHADLRNIKRVLDVGIGSGAFIQAMIDHINFTIDAMKVPFVYGYDVNPVAARWLGDRGKWADLYAPGEQFDCVTFWDSLEHIADPRRALKPCRKWVFVSIPIFQGVEHVLRSKHYRKAEHYHYWTRAGFIRFADSQGFEVIDITATESALGREDIETFVLKRRGS